MKAAAFAPGHISAFFEPRYHPSDIYRSGSRGAGMSITLGATSEVTVEPADKQLITITINNKNVEAPVTRNAIVNLIADTKLNIRVHTILCLPESQGFGMSAAGALSATMALAKLVHLSESDALKAAHRAEIQQHTGLGDVVACSFGGIEIRREPGLPPWGILEHIPGSYDVVVCVVGEKIQTKTILSDRQKLEEIATYGRYCTKKLLEKPSLEHFFRLAQEFTYKTGLADNKVLNAIAAANQVGMASMCMLGNSVFAVGKTQKLCTVLEPFGKTYLCSVSQVGATIF